MHKWKPAAALLAATAALSGCGKDEITAFDRTWEIKTGDWHVEGGAIVGKGGVLMSADDQADMVLEVDIDAGADLGERGIGVGFHQQPRAPGVEGEKKAGGYGFNFSGNKTYNVFRGVDNAWTPVNPAFTTYQPSPALDAAKNHVVIRVVGKKADIDVNGKRVASVDDATFPRGRIALWVESAATPVRFSGIRVSKPANR
jgi:hypothetical protein